MQQLGHLPAISEGRWMFVASSDEVQEGIPFAIEIEGYSMVLCRVAGDEYYATDNLCTHGNALLSEGWLEDCVIECPLHAGQFDVRTGKALCAPVEQDLRIYPVEVRRNEVFVLLPPE